MAPARDWEGFEPKYFWCTHRKYEKKNPQIEILWHRLNFKREKEKYMLTNIFILVSYHSKNFTDLQLYLPELKDHGYISALTLL